MSDEIILDGSSGSSTPREQHPTGQHLGVCVDVIDLGERVEDYAGKPKRLTRKVEFVWMTGQKDSEGRYFELSREFTLSSHEKAGLPKFLGTWRGTPLTEAEIKAGMRLSQFVGMAGVLQIVPKMSSSGKTYSRVDIVTPLFPGLQPPVLPAYTRADFRNTRKAEYAEEAAKFKAASAPTARGATTVAPVAPQSDAQAVASMVAAEQAAQSDLPPF